MTLSTEDLSPEEPSGLVTWMEPGALRLGGAGVATLLAGAFALDHSSPKLDQAQSPPILRPQAARAGSLMPGVRRRTRVWVSMSP